MKRYLPTILVAFAAALSAQQSGPPAERGVVVRNVGIKGTQQLPRVSFETIQTAWRENGVGLNTELKTTPETLAEIASRADKVIQRVYGDAGQPVLVEHEIEILPPLNRYVEIRFTVTPAAISK
jgi:hypothetical protein